MLDREAQAQPELQSGVEGCRITCPLEQKRFLESSFYTGRNQRGSRPSLPGVQAVHAVAFRRVPIPPRRRRLKSAFVDMDGMFATAKEPFAKAQELFMLLWIAFVVPDPFLMDDL